MTVIRPYYGDGHGLHMLTRLPGFYYKYYLISAGVRDLGHS